MKTQLTDKFTQILLDPGETVAICRCGQSDAWPICDGHHKTAESKGRECTPAFISAKPTQTEPLSTD